MTIDVLAGKIARLSRRPDNGDAKPTRNETIVLAIGIEHVNRAFGVARERLGRNPTEVVRVIAPGATLEASWPDWVKRDHPSLRLTEPGAFNHDPLVDSTWTLQNELRDWLDITFRGVFRNAPSPLLFTSACARFLQTPIATYPIAKALGSTFSGAVFIAIDDGFHTINGGWDPSLFEQIIRRSGGRVENLKPQKQRGAWAARLLGVGAFALGGAIVRQTSEYVKNQPSRALVDRLRRRPKRPEPSVWVTVIADWARVNSIALDAFALPALRRGEQIGVLLVDNLRRGARDETSQKQATNAADALWPGMAALREHLDACTVEQAVQPESPPAYVSALAKGACGSMLGLMRLARSPDIRTTDGFAISLDQHLWPLVSLATLDVLRGAVVERATQDLTNRISFDDRIAIVSCSSTVNLAAVDLTLQRANATTLNSPDGSGSDTWTGVGSTVSTARVVWTEADARSIGRSCDHVVVAGMPLRMKLPPRQRRPRNILLLNNHGHREFCVGGVFRERAFQNELLSLPRHLRENHAQTDLVFRWRPHPAATEESIRDGLADVVEVELSRGQPLEVDAEWADLVVCGYSTSIIEILFSSIPVFVQARSELLGLPAHDFLNDDRVFFYAAEGATKIAHYLSQEVAVNMDVRLAPENQARERLFGFSQVPLPASEALRYARSNLHVSRAKRNDP